jgi:hypothetical protein
MTLSKQYLSAIANPLAGTFIGTDIADPPAPFPVVTNADVGVAVFS